MMDVVTFIKAHLTPYKIKWDASGEDYDAGTDRQVITERTEQADVYSSQIRNQWNDGRHYVALDIDYDAYLVESSTPGHHHLYLRVPGGVIHEEYMELLELLGKLNVIEPGYAKASITRGHTDLRPPWVKKGEEPGRQPQLSLVSDEVEL